MANDRARYYRQRAERKALALRVAAANRSRATATGRAWAERNPEKIKAQRETQRAIRSGELIRGECEMSDAECSGRIESHHKDYSKPLDVTWLCVYHHGYVRRMAA